MSKPVPVPELRVLTQPPVPLLKPRHGHSPQVPAGSYAFVALFRTDCHTSLAANYFQVHFQISFTINCYLFRITKLLEKPHPQSHYKLHSQSPVYKETVPAEIAPSSCGDPRVRNLFLGKPRVHSRMEQNSTPTEVNVHTKTHCSQTSC